MTSPLMAVFLNAPIDRSPEPAGRVFGKGFRWDFEAGDFALDGNGRLIEVDDHEAFIQWCILALKVQRGAFPVYSQQFGIDVLEVMGANTKVAETEAQMVIEDALANSDNRVYLVGGFTFERTGTSLVVEFTVVPTEGSPELLTVDLGG